MITAQTAASIWATHREIEAGEQLLMDIKKERENPLSDRDKFAPSLKDAFGRKQHFQMSIPSGSNCHTLLKVGPQLAESVIRAHIAEMKARLVQENELARIELGFDTPQKEAQS